MRVGMYVYKILTRLQNKHEKGCLDIQHKNKLLARICYKIKDIDIVNFNLALL